MIKNQKNEDTKSAWASIVDGNDFLSRMTTAVRIRGNMDSEAFARHIALTSGAPNKPQFIRGARTVIAILQAADKIKEEEDGTLKAIETEMESVGDVSVQHYTTIQNAEPVFTPELQPKIAQTSKHLLSIMIQISPKTTDEELEQVAQKIKYLSRLLDSDEAVSEDDADVS